MQFMFPAQFQVPRLGTPQARSSVMGFLQLSLALHCPIISTVVVLWNREVCWRSSKRKRNFVETRVHQCLEQACKDVEHKLSGKEFNTMHGQGCSRNHPQGGGGRQTFFCPEGGGVFGKNMSCGWGSIAPNLVLGVEGSYFAPAAKFFV